MLLGLTDLPDISNLPSDRRRRAAHANGSHTDRALGARAANGAGQTHGRRNGKAHGASRRNANGGSQTERSGKTQQVRQQRFLYTDVCVDTRNETCVYGKMREHTKKTCKKDDREIIS